MTSFSMNRWSLNSLNILEKAGRMGSVDIRTSWGYFSRNTAVASSNLRTKMILKLRGSSLYHIILKSTCNAGS